MKLRQPRQAIKDATGRVFGRLTVERLLGINEKRHSIWECQCLCGNKIAVPLYSMTTGNTRSCGCLHIDTVTTHGHTKGTCRGVHPSKEYSSWLNMIARCENDNVPDWKYYGERGIRICAGLRKFDDFIEHMGRKPTPKHSIDRVNNSGHYSCGGCEECVSNGWKPNCRWATRKEQDRNKSSNRLLTHSGETYCLTEWAERVGMKPSTLSNRIHSGMSVEKALTTPVRKRLK